MSVGETSSKVSSSKRLNSESDIQDIETDAFPDKVSERVER